MILIIKESEYHKVSRDQILTAWYVFTEKGGTYFKMKDRSGILDAEYSSLQQLLQEIATACNRVRGIDE